MKYKVLLGCNLEFFTEEFSTKTLTCGQAVADALRPLYESAGVEFLGVVSVEEADVTHWN